MVNAGRILILPRGNWDNLTTYDLLDLVTASNNIAYIARQQSVGVNPITDATNTYWQPFGSTIAVDSETILIDTNGVISVNLDNDTLVYDATAGYIKVDASQIDKALSSLTDVSISSIQAGQALMWDAVNSKWVNGTISTTLSGLTDVTITSPADGQGLKYDATTQKWVNGNVASTAQDISYDNTSSGLIATNAQGAIDEVASGVPGWSITVACLIGDTSLTISDTRITSSSTVELFKETGTADVNILTKTITTGQIVYTFDALEDATTFRVRITNAYGMTGGNQIYFSDLGDVNFQTPLDGQVPVYNGSTHKWENLQIGADYHWSNAVSCLTGDTDCTITNSHILTTSVIEPVSDPPGLPYTDMTVTNGQVVITFPALTQAASIKVKITN